MSEAATTRWNLIHDANYCGINPGIGKKMIFEGYDLSAEEVARRDLIVRAVNFYLDYIEADAGAKALPLSSHNRATAQGE